MSNFFTNNVGTSGNSRGITYMPPMNRDKRKPSDFRKLKRHRLDDHLPHKISCSNVPAFCHSLENKQDVNMKLAKPLDVHQRLQSSSVNICNQDDKQTITSNDKKMPAQQQEVSNGKSKTTTSTKSKKKLVIFRLERILPPEVPYTIRKSNYSCERRTFGIDLKLETKQEFLMWLERHEIVCGVKYVAKNLQDRPSPSVDFRGSYQCNAFIRSSHKKKSSRIQCPSKLNCTILSHSRKPKFGVDKCFMTVVMIEFNHQHRLNSTSSSCPKPTEIEDHQEVEILEYTKPLPEVVDLIDDVNKPDICIRDLLMNKITQLQELRSSDIKIDMIPVNKDDFRIGIVFISTLNNVVIKNCGVVLIIHRVKILHDCDVIVVSIVNATRRLPFAVFITSSDATNLSSVVLRDFQEVLTTNCLDVNNVKVVVTDISQWKLDITKTFPNAEVSNSVHLIMFDVWVWLWTSGNLIDVNDTIRCSLFSVICRLFNLPNREDLDCKIFTDVLFNADMKISVNFLDYFSNQIKRLKNCDAKSDIDNKNTVDVLREVLLSDLILLEASDGSLLSLLDFFVKYSLQEIAMLSQLEEKSYSFNIADFNDYCYKISCGDKKEEYIVDKKFGFCNCDRALKGWYCMHRKIVLCREFRQKTIDIEIGFGNVDVDGGDLPGQIDKVKGESVPIETMINVEDTKQKLHAIMDNLLGRWNENSKHDIASAVDILYERCLSTMII